MNTTREDMQKAKILYYGRKHKIDSLKAGIDLYSFTQLYLIIKEDVIKKISK